MDNSHKIMAVVFIIAILFLLSEKILCEAKNYQLENLIKEVKKCKTEKEEKGIKNFMGLQNFLSVELGLKR